MRSLPENTNGKTLLRHHHDHITTSIEVVDADIEKRREAAYIVTVDQEVKYIGEFSNSLRDRWIKVENYIWHHKDHLIFDALNRGCDVSLSLVDNPEVSLPSGELVNISKAIEHHILKHHKLEWNMRNNNLVKAMA